MTPDEIKLATEGWREKHRRLSWSPLTSKTATSQSYFGGTPDQSSSAQWPLCAECKQPMQFFLQLDLAGLPSEFGLPHQSGLLQLFYCGSDDGLCETWAPFTGTHEIRVCSESVAIERPQPIKALERVSITAWDKFEDLPHAEDHEQLGLNYDYDFDKGIVSVACENPPISMPQLNIDLDVAELIAGAKTGDKLGGWPAWIQGAEYPNCPDCNSSMELLFQIDSEDNLTYMFGDMGIAHLTFCPNHPEVFAFAWACG